MIDTKQPEALITGKGQVPAIQRYKIGYHSDEWGVRSSTPSGILDASGSWVRYADHIAAQADNERLRDKLARSGVEQHRAVREAIKAEREACAKVCESLYSGTRIQPTRSECADAIRNRK